MTVEGPRVKVFAPAKLTLSLHVAGVRPDGYHLIEAEMVSLDLVDELLIDPTGTGVELEIDGVVRPASEDDLVVRALEKVDRNAAVTITKRIPMGAGLGGGSSDAAAILRWANHLDMDTAVSIGADVAFCLRGGRALVSGIGERVDPLAFEERTFTLLTPPIHASTPVVYRTWDAMGGPGGSNGNDLEPAAIKAYPDLAKWRDDLSEQTGQSARLAGSGSTWFVEGDHPGCGRVVCRTTPPIA